MSLRNISTKVFVHKVPVIGLSWILITWQVSDPEHHRYGQHLSISEVSELVAPSEEALGSVRAWLADHGIGEGSLAYSPARDWIMVTLPVSTVERLLDTQYSVYQHEDGDALVRTPEWSLPKHLHEYIETIQPTNSFFRTKPVAKLGKFVQAIGSKPTRWYPPAPSSTLSAAQACNTSAVTPDCLRTLYGTIDYKPKVPGKNKVGLTDYLGEANNRSDVRIFLQNYRPDAVSAAYKFTVKVIDGGDDQVRSAICMRFHQF